MTSERIAALARKLAENHNERYHTPRDTSTKDNAAPLNLPEVGEKLPPVQKLMGGDKED